MIKAPWGKPMRNILIALLLIVPSVAQAQFRSTPPKADLPSSLDCGILSVSPPERDDDPVHWIGIVPTYDNKLQVESLVVTHTTVFGRSFVRSEQYSGDYLRQTPAPHLEIEWRGSSKKKPSMIMTGRVWKETRTGRYFYSEIIEEGGQASMRMLAGCREGA